MAKTYDPTDDDINHAEWLLTSRKLVRDQIGNRRWARLLRETATMNQTKNMHTRTRAAFEINWMLQEWEKMRDKGVL